MKIILLFLLGILYSPKNTDTIDLKIVITNIHAIKGNIEMGVFNDPKTFLVKGKEYKNYTKKVTNNSLIFELKGVPKDNYAISVYHDKNADNKCNLNFIGIPEESYGFSKNFKPKFSKPKFEDCKINAENDMTITIKLLD